MRRDWLVWPAQAVCLAIFYAAPVDAAAVAAGIAFAVLAGFRTDLALSFVVLTAPFHRFPREVAGLGLTLSEVAIGLTLAGWIGRQALDRSARGWFDRAASRDPLGPYLPAIGCLAVGALSLLASEYPRYSLREFRLVIVEPLAFTLVVLAVGGRTPVVRILLRALIGIGAIVGAIGIYHYFYVGVTEATGGVERALAIYHSPNALGLFLGRIAPIALAVAVLGRGLGADRRLAAGAAIVIGFAIFLTYSRGAWLGVAAAVILIAAGRGWRTLIGAAVAIGAGGIALSRFVNLGRLASESSSSQRIYLWEAAQAMIRDHPWLGVGLDNFLYQYPRYMNPAAWREPNISHPHNIVLDFWLRLGLAGLGWLIWVQVSFWRAGIRAWRALAGRPERAIPIALMASMIDFLVHGLIDNSYFLIDLAIVFWVSFALVHLCAGAPFLRDSAPVPKGTPLPASPVHRQPPG